VSGLGALWSALAVVVDSSDALAAAQRAWRERRPISEVVRAFAERTDNRFDDKLAAELTTFLEQAVHVLRRAAVYAVRVSLWCQKAAPTVVYRCETILTRAEQALPAARDALKAAEGWAVAVHHGARDVSETAQRLADRLEALETERT